MPLIRIFINLQDSNEDLPTELQLLRFETLAEIYHRCMQNESIKQIITDAINYIPAFQQIIVTLKNNPRRIINGGEDLQQIIKQNYNQKELELQFILPKETNKIIYILDNQKCICLKQYNVYGSLSDLLRMNKIAVYQKITIDDQEFDFMTIKGKTIQYLLNNKKICVLKLNTKEQKILPNQKKTKKENGNSAVLMEKRQSLKQKQELKYPKLKMQAPKSQGKPKEVESPVKHKIIQTFQMIASFQSVLGSGQFGEKTLSFDLNLQNNLEQCIPQIMKSLKNNGFDWNEQDNANYKDKLKIIFDEKTFFKYHSKFKLFFKSKDVKLFKFSRHYDGGHLRFK